MLELKFETNYRDRLYKFTFEDMQSQMGYVAVDDKDHAMINAENPRIFVGVKDKNGKDIYFGNTLRVSFTLTNIVISKVDFKRGIFFVLNEQGQYPPISDFFYDSNNVSKQLEIINDS
ncbi:MAG: hypothetical protein IPL26_12835 [Leptospiraceae bacterium]|nr:hypothetical protein [Leptospiraceae bacterium]